MPSPRGLPHLTHQGVPTRFTRVPHFEPRLKVRCRHCSSLIGPTNLFLQLNFSCLLLSCHFLISEVMWFPSLQNQFSGSLCPFLCRFRNRKTGARGCRNNNFAKVNDNTSLCRIYAGAEGSFRMQNILSSPSGTLRFLRGLSPLFPHGRTLWTIFCLKARWSENYQQLPSQSLLLRP